LSKVVFFFFYGLQHTPRCSRFRGMDRPFWWALDRQSEDGRQAVCKPQHLSQIVCLSLKRPMKGRFLSDQFVYCKSENIKADHFL
jgi:hypothetical protein